MDPARTFLVELSYTVPLCVVAVLAVVLQRALIGADTTAAQASAFGTAFWASAGLAMLAIIPCVILMRAERAARAVHPEMAHESTEAAVEAVAA